MKINYKTTTINYRSLSTYGVIPLTGERCPYAMRILCDLTPEGRILITDFLGLPRDTKFDEPWNSSQGQDASIMLPKSLLPDLYRFIIFNVLNLAYAVHSQETGDVYGYEDLSESYLTTLRESKYLRLYHNFNYRPNMPPRNFNRHEFSGRQ